MVVPARGHNSSVLSDKSIASRTPDAWSAGASGSRHRGADWLPYLPRHRHDVYLTNGGGLEHAQEIAAHESLRTAKLCDRTKERLTE